MRALFLFVCLVLLVSSSFAQKQQEADSLLNNCDYFEAEEIYAHLLKKNPYDSRLNLKWGRCLLAINKPKEAIIPLERAARRFPEANSYLGDAYLMEYRFYDALKVYRKLLRSADVDSITYLLMLKLSEQILPYVC
jgi:tetratricopeptide (TPR) repeat protein